MKDGTGSNDRTRGGNGKFIRDIDTVKRDAYAAQLRSRGWTYQQIGDELGTDKGTAFEAVKRAMAEVIAEPAAEAVAFSIRRLDEQRVRLNDLRDKVMEILERKHVTVVQGQVVYDGDGEAVPDDEFTLKTVDRLLKIDAQLQSNDESMRTLLGTNSPTKTQVSGGLTYEVVGVDPAQLT